MIDCRLPLRSILPDRAEALARLAPYGQGFEEPVFICEGVRIVRCWPSGVEGRNLRLVLRESNSHGSVERVALWPRQGSRCEELRRVPDAEPSAPTPEIVEAVAAVKRYFEGERTDFSEFKLDLNEQGAFFNQIYAAARLVGWGHTTTYGTLAKQVGAGPEAARDVGEAMAKNPVPLIIPCHRVLAAGGKVGGFSAPGGSAAKIRMLGLEGVHVEPPRPAQQSLRL